MARTEDPGCRDAALATALLLGIGLALMGSGLALVNQDSCDAACEFFGLGILYSGGPISAVIGFLTDSLIVAWPLEIILWVVLGFWSARLGATRGRSAMGYAVAILGVALVFGFTLSQFVELVELA